VTEPAGCPTPRDVAERLAEQARRELARRLAVVRWNEQLEAVVDIVLDAEEAGRGVIITTTAWPPTIVARSTTYVGPGRAAIFRTDHVDPRPIFRTIRTDNLRRTA